MLEFLQSPSPDYNQIAVLVSAIFVGLCSLLSVVVASYIAIKQASDKAETQTQLNTITAATDGMNNRLSGGLDAATVEIARLNALLVDSAKKEPT